MKDQILSGYLEDFLERMGTNNNDEAQTFAQFSSYCILAKQTGNAPAHEVVDVDGGQDTGIDSIAIIINERVIEDIEEVDYFKNLGRMDVEFVFIQEKSSPRFDAGDIGNFIFGVRNFFHATPNVKASAKIDRLRAIKDYIYKNSIALKKAPICRLYYISTGKWTNDDYLTGRIQSETDPLRETGLFTEACLIPIDGDKLKSYYRELRNRIEKEVVFEKHTILPKIQGVDEAYLGILPLAEFLKLISDEEGELQRNLFYDNVRDYQGENPVNTEITHTVTTQTQAETFVLLNNGITIVARTLKKIGASFQITDYQIVNGCQTSNVLHSNKDKVGADIFVPVKLIVTGDPELTNQIIKATNRQTEVKLEAFESLSPFHRLLEEFYRSIPSTNSRKLHYERRSKQYANTAVDVNLVISLATQAKAFLAMFLNEPHSTHRYYGEILENYGDRLFQEKHCPDPYYAAAFALNQLDNLIRNRNVPVGAKNFKYHLLLVVRLAINSSEYPPLSGKKGEEFAARIIDSLSTPEKAAHHFNEAYKTIQSRLSQLKSDQTQANRLRMFTNMLLPSTTKRPTAIVTSWQLERGFGFAKTPDGKSIFVHCSAIRDPIHKYLRDGETIEYDLIEDEKGARASDVRLVPKSASRET